MRKSINVHKIHQLTGHRAAIYALEKGNANNTFLSGAGEGWIVEWEMPQSENGQLKATVETNIFSLCHLPKENLVVAGNMNGGIHWVDLVDPNQTKNIAHHKKGVYALLPIGNSLYSLGGDGLLTKWAITQKRSVESLQVSHERLRSITYWKHEQCLVIGSSDGNIYLIDETTFQVKHTIQNAHDNTVFSLQLHPNQAYLISGGRDAHLKVWDLQNNFECISDQAAHWFTINTIAIHPTLPIFATGSRDKTIKIWDSTTFQLLKVIDTARNGGHLNSVNALLWLENNYLISASDDRSIICWQIELNS